MAVSRFRNWTTLVYPESCAPDWVDYLREECIPTIISPLHDSDISDDGSLKKEHYHVIFVFDGNKTEAQVKLICERIKSIGLKNVTSLRSYARYLIHLDDPDKFQYLASNVICIGGLDYYEFVNLPSEKYTMISEMLCFCEENNIYSYHELLLYARDNRYDWFRSLCDNSTLVMKEFLKSRYWALEKSDNI